MSGSLRSVAGMKGGGGRQNALMTPHYLLQVQSGPITERFCHTVCRSLRRLPPSRSLTLKKWQPRSYEVKHKCDLVRRKPAINEVGHDVVISRAIFFSLSPLFKMQRIHVQKYELHSNKILSFQFA